MLSFLMFLLWFFSKKLPKHLCGHTAKKNLNQQKKEVFFKQGKLLALQKLKGSKKRKKAARERLGQQIRNLTQKMRN